MTCIDILPLWSEVKPSGNYVYIHFRKSDGLPFYVGLGQGSRGWTRSAGHRSSWWHRVASKHGACIEIAQDGLSRDDAVLLEMWLIAKLKHECFPLVNLTDGGDGALGAVRSESSIRLTSEAKVGKPRSMETRIKLGKAVCNSDGERFETISLAVEHLKYNGFPLASQSSISMACSGKSTIAYGFRWRWADSDFHNKKTHGLSVPVISCRGEFFESMTKASIDLTGDASGASGISACIRKKQKTAHGRGWSYA